MRMTLPYVFLLGLFGCVCLRRCTHVNAARHLLYRWYSKFSKRTNTKKVKNGRKWNKIQAKDDYLTKWQPSFDKACCLAALSELLSRIYWRRLTVFMRPVIFHGVMFRRSVAENLELATSCQSFSIGQIVLFLFSPLPFLLPSRNLSRRGRCRAPTSVPNTSWRTCSRRRRSGGWDARPASSRPSRWPRRPATSPLVAHRLSRRRKVGTCPLSAFFFLF